MNETLNINQVADRLDISPRTVRQRIKDRMIPQPLKRKSDHEKLKWRTADIDKFLGVENQPAANDAAPSLDALIDAIVEQKVREVLEEKLPQIQQLISQI